MSTVRITYTDKNSSIDKRIIASIDKKKIINKFIREGKELKNLNDKGIKLKMPL